MGDHDGSGQVRSNLVRIGLDSFGQDSSVRSGHSGPFNSVLLRYGKLVSSCLRSGQVSQVDQDRLG